jgi:hypothetical protein
LRAVRLAELTVAANAPRVWVMSGNMIEATIDTGKPIESDAEDPSVA